VLWILETYWSVTNYKFRKRMWLLRKWPRKRKQLKQMTYAYINGEMHTEMVKITHVRIYFREIFLQHLKSFLLIIWWAFSEPSWCIVMRRDAWRAFSEPSWCFENVKTFFYYLRNNEILSPKHPNIQFSQVYARLQLEYWTKGKETHV